MKTTLLLNALMICLIFGSSDLRAQSSESKASDNTLDNESAWSIISELDAKFSENYLLGDSLALAATYTSDAQFGCLEGAEIAAAWGKSIRKSILNNTRTLKFTALSVWQQDEFLISVGTYEKFDAENNRVSDGRYLITWKMEDGVWKIYRDFGL